MANWDKLLEGDIDTMVQDYFESGDAARDMAALNIEPQDEVGCITCGAIVPRSEARCIDVAYGEHNQEVPLYECKGCLPDCMKLDLYDKAVCPDLDVSGTAICCVCGAICTISEVITGFAQDSETPCDHFWFSYQHNGWPVLE